MVPAGPALALLRLWDQSERYLVLLNPHSSTLRPFSVSREPGVQLGLPPVLTLRYSTGPVTPGHLELRLEELKVGPYVGMMLGFPHNPK